MENFYLHLGIGVALFLSSWICYYYWPANAPRRKQILLLFALSLGTRVVLFFLPESDDFNRYLWEGKLVRAGENPYLHPADAPVREPHRDGYWEEMNHHSETTIYPPLMQLVFAATGAIGYHAIPLKVLIVGFDIGIIALLLRVVKLRYLALYALNPVPLISYAWEGHFDSIMVFFMVLAVLCYRRSPVWAWVALGLAIQVKLIAVLLGPILLLRAWKSSWVLLPTLVLPCLPFLDGVGEMVRGILTFGGDFSGNGPIHLLVEIVSGSKRIAGVVSAMVLLGAMGWALWQRFEMETYAFFVIGALVVISPTVTYWYIGWVLPFALISRSLSWWILSGTSIFYYAAWWYLEVHGEWWHPVWAMALQWIPFYLSLLFADRLKALCLKRSRS